MTYDLLGFLPRDAMQARSLLSCSVCLIPRSGHSLTLNISEMAKDTTIVTMEGE